MQRGQHCSFYTCETEHDKRHTAGGHVRTAQHNSGMRHRWAWIFLGPQPPDKTLDGLKFPARLLGDKQYPPCVRRLQQTFVLPLNGHRCGSPQVPERQKILCFTLNLSHNKICDEIQSYLGGIAQRFYLKLFYIKSNLYYLMIKAQVSKRKATGSVHIKLSAYERWSQQRVTAVWKGLELVLTFMGNTEPCHREEPGCVNEQTCA